MPAEPSVDKAVWLSFSAENGTQLYLLPLLVKHLDWLQLDQCSNKLDSNLNARNGRD